MNTIIERSTLSYRCHSTKLIIIYIDLYTNFVTTNSIDRRFQLASHDSWFFFFGLPCHLQICHVIERLYLDLEEKRICQSAPPPPQFFWLFFARSIMNIRPNEFKSPSILHIFICFVLCSFPIKLEKNSMVIGNMTKHAFSGSVYVFLFIVNLSSRCNQ